MAKKKLTKAQVKNKIRTAKIALYALYFDNLKENPSKYIQN